ncbi:MAG TPA: alpha/beta hydrolase, partial [Candidatus Kapabacteria bacterium]|nr:alpha/beta hydrolase [Candidatus Kapabacteria bacterium]
MNDRVAFVIPANNSNKEKPWVWYAPALPGLPGTEERWMFEQFVSTGISIAGIDVGESYGSPAGRKIFSAFHAEMVRRGFSAKPVLLGRSRGGLMTLSWAAENPEKLSGFAGIYPVCNIVSYPGIEKAAPAYEMSPDELRSQLAKHNPVDRLAALAKAHVPLFAIHGDVDLIVPLQQNSGLMRDRYKALGGSMQLIVPAGQGHNMWRGFFECHELVEFVKKYATPSISLSSPLDFQVFQRRSRENGMLTIQGELTGTSGKKVRLEARLIVNGRPTRWRQVR